MPLPGKMRLCYHRTGRAFLFCLLLLWRGHESAVVQALPFGAPVCPASTSAPGPPHRPPSGFTELPIADGGLNITIDGEALVPGQTKQVVVGRSYEVVISSNGFFRGVLARISGGNAQIDTTASFSLVQGDTLLQISNPCVTLGVGGVTHTSNEDKDHITFLMEFDEASANMALDLNIVQQIRPSIFYYSQYLLSALPGEEETRLPLLEIIAQTFVLQLLEAYVGFGGIASDIFGEGPFAMITPWDSAFERLDPELITKLQSRSWNAHLKNLLQFHIHNGSLELASLGAIQTVTMANGEGVQFRRRPGTDRVRVNDVLVLATYEATNGYVYMSEEVLLPAWAQNSLLMVAQTTSSLSTFASLGVTAGFEGILDDSSQALTVFAPSNEAFSALGKSALDFLTSPEGLSLLRDTLSYHLAVDGPHPSQYFVGTRVLPTVQGDTVQVVNDATGISITGSSNSAMVTGMDAGLGYNGIVHLLDTVLEAPSSPS